MRFGSSPTSLNVPSSSTLNVSPRPLKRKRSILDFTELQTRFLNGRHLKRAKSENVSLLKRYLIGCAHVIYVKMDTRDRDDKEDVIPLAVPLKKSYAPSSDLPQKDMVALYFDDIDRTVVSQSKSKTHLFAAPDFSSMNPYLFPWIRFNSLNPQINLTRLHIKHVAFRIWEYLATQERVVIKHEDVLEQPENVPLGDVRGWWWESDGEYPRGYEAWYLSNSTSLPADYHRVLLKALGKPWPTRVSTLGLMVDDKTPAPTVYIDTSDESPSPQIRPSKPRSLSDYGTAGSVDRRERSSAPRPYERPPMQRSHTQPSSPKQRGLAIPDILNRYRTQTPADPMSLKMRALPPPTLPLPADIGDWFGVPSIASYVVPEYQYAEHSLLDGRSHSLGSTESYATPIFEASHYSWNTTTPASPESCGDGVLNVPVNNLVGSNFDPTLHTDKFWLKYGFESTQQYVAQPLSSNDVVVKKEVEVQYSGSLLPNTPSGLAATGPVVVDDGNPLQYPSPHSSSDHASPSGSQCSSIDPRLLLLDNSGEDTDELSQSLFVNASSPRQEEYVAEPSPAPEELSFDDFLVESAPYPVEGWNGLGGAGSFFDDILFRGSE